MPFWTKQGQWDLSGQACWKKLYLIFFQVSLFSISRRLGTKMRGLTEWGSRPERLRSILCLTARKIPWCLSDIYVNAKCILECLTLHGTQPSNISILSSSLSFLVCMVCSTMSCLAIFIYFDLRGLYWAELAVILSPGRSLCPSV